MERKQKYDVPFNIEVDIAFHTDSSSDYIALWLSEATVYWTLDFYSSLLFSLSSPLLSFSLLLLLYHHPPSFCLLLIFHFDKVH